MTKIIADIDADILLYRIGYVTEEDTLEEAKKTMDRAIEKLLYVTEATHYAGFLTSSSDNFRVRRAVTAPYKGNRASREKPKHFYELRKHLIEHWKFFDCVGIEADDAIIIGKVYWEGQGYHVIICSSDKDSLQEPGTHCNPVTGEMRIISESQALRNLCVQLITGDATDNIKGLSEYVNCDTVKARGTKLDKSLLFGPKTAENLLDSWDEELWIQRIMELYCDMYAYRDIDDGQELGDAGMSRFHENWDLLYMLRQTPEDVDLDLSIWEAPDVFEHVHTVEHAFAPVNADNNETEY